MLPARSRPRPSRPITGVWSGSPGSTGSGWPSRPGIEHRAAAAGELAGRSGDGGPLVAEAKDLAPRFSLQGQPLPARLPCTATVLPAGEISPKHVAIIRRTMTKIERMEHVDPAEVPAAEASLAAQATRFPPATLQRLAERCCASSIPMGRRRMRTRSCSTR